MVQAGHSLAGILDVNVDDRPARLSVRVGNIGPRGEGEEEIFPDPLSESMAESWRNGVFMGLEHQNAAFLEAASVT